MTEVSLTDKNGYMHADIPLNSEEWLGILASQDTPKEYVDILLKFYYEPWHEATCTKVGRDYGISASSVNAYIMQFGKYVSKQKDIVLKDDNDDRRFWPVIMDGKEQGSLFSYRIKDELRDAVVSYLYRYLLDKYKHYREEVPVKGMYNGHEKDEAYKWELVTDCQGKDLLQQADLWKETNLYDKVRNRPIVKSLIENNGEEYNKILSNLCDESKDLSERLETYRSEMNAIVDKKYSSKADDERTAATILACQYPQKYTFYKSNDVYSGFCDYLGIESVKEVSHKYPHFLKLIQPLKELVHGDEGLSSIVNPYLKDYLQSDLLLAQDICWCLFAMDTSFLDLPPKKSSKEYASRKVWCWNSFGDPQEMQKQNSIAMGSSAKEITDYESLDTKKKLRDEFQKHHGNSDVSIPNAYWKFIHEVEKGDIVVACSNKMVGKHNTHDLYGWGIIDSDIIIDKDDDNHLKRKVKWHKPFLSDPIGDKELKNSLFFHNTTPSQAQTIIELLDINLDDMKIKDYVKPYIGLLKSNNNIILTGAPGTGKTFLAKEIANEMGAETGFVQFHPSYDYTDFVEGLRPTPPDANGNIGFERKDGVFKQFCERALQNEIDSEETTQDISSEDDIIEKKDYIFIIDEINRGEISKIFGELFFSIDPGYRGVKGATRTQYANMQTEANVFDKYLVSKGITVNGYGNFFVPDNVYIIGTMNDIDRSVESMDFAMRRRFAWQEVTAKESMDNILNKENNPNVRDIDDDTLSELKVRMTNLNDAIIGQYKSNSNVNKTLRLGSAYQIGGAYFQKYTQYMHSDRDKAIEKLWNNHIKNVLMEYLRGNSNIKEQIGYLHAAYEDTADHKNDVETEAGEPVNQ